MIILSRQVMDPPGCCLIAHPICVTKSGANHALDVPAAVGRCLSVLIAVAFTEDVIRADLPVRWSVLHRYRRLTRRRGRAGGMAMLSGVAAISTDYRWLWWAVVLLVLVGLFTVAQRAWGWIDARPVEGTSLVELRRVSEKFASALEAPEVAAAPRGRRNESRRVSLAPS
jgi:hypothetical protein